jgi:predicted DNA-binding antitoxin AbrB/MazE fold protein
MRAAMQIPANYVNGVFQPTVPVALPENTPVNVIPAAITSEVGSQQEKNSLDRIYELLEQSIETGIPDLAARHNGHQP